MSALDSHPQPAWRIHWPTLLAPATFAILTLLLFNDALFDSTKVIASKSTDLAMQFLPWRKFGFDQLSQGNLALWNPHVFGGAPYFAGFQSALLYPPNWLHLILPVGLAISWINALHVFAAGMFTYAWCRHRTLSRGASILAGVMFMFSGPYFPHIYAGHLPHIAIMVWAPVLFLAIDLLVDGYFRRGSMLGICAMAMFLLAGHPQYVYYTGIAAAIYVLVNLLRFKRAPIGLAGCALIVVGGVALAAVQLLAGIDALTESVRSAGTKYEFSAMFSFPPENALTAIAPNVFGGLPTRNDVVPPEAYFGRCYYWEVCLFVSICGLILAIYGAISAPGKVTRGAVVMTIACFILALGAHTPLHRILYDYLPGFSGFRGSVKFNYLVALFLAVLAACGMDTAQRARRTPITLLSIAVALLTATLTLTLMIRSSASVGLGGAWHRALRSALEAAIDDGEFFIDSKLLGQEHFIIDAGKTASAALGKGAGAIAAVVIILVLARFKGRAIVCLIPLAVVEMLVFAGSTRATMDAVPELPAGWAQVIEFAPADARFLQMNGMSNMGMWFGHHDLWGYDPGVQKRYAELLTVSQGIDPNSATQYIPFQRAHPKIFPLLRTYAVLRNDPRQPAIFLPPVMSRAQLVSSAVVLESRDSILRAMLTDSFDPRQMVLLERQPSIVPARSMDPGSVQILSESTDHLELIAEARSNAILLVTDAYSRGWRVEPVGQPGQNRYEILPANWALQGIPLQTGKHHLRFEYRPGPYVVGKWISIFSLMGYLAAVFWFFISGYRKQTSSKGSVEGESVDTLPPEAW